MKRSKPTDAERALLKWTHRANVYPEAGREMRYMIIPSGEHAYAIVQCYRDSWNVSNTIAHGLTRQQAEHRVARIVERSDCEVV